MSVINMCLKLKYFVLALFLDTVASSPLNIPRHEAALYPINEYDIQRRNEESRSFPSYMSPVPSVVDAAVNQELLRQPINLRDPRSLDYNTNENFRTIEQLPSVAQSTRSYGNPSSLNGNEVLSHLLRLNTHIVNNVETSAPVNSRDIQNKFYGERFNQLQSNENVRSEALNQLRNNNYETLRPQSIPEQRIAFQPLVPSMSNLDAYHPAIPVKTFNIDSEWSRINREQPKLPDFISERLSHPVDFRRIQLNGQQIHKPSNAELPGMGPEYNIQKIMADQRIQNVLSSNKQTKRYLVIHPDGKVEHVDNLAPIAAQHPDYVLVNAGHVVKTNNLKPDLNITKNIFQIPSTSPEPISSSKVSVVSGPQVPEPLSKNEDAIMQTSSSDTPILVEAVSTSESTISPELAVVLATVVNTPPSPPTKIDKTDQTSETAAKSLGNEESEIDNSSKTEVKNSLGVNGTEETVVNVVESSSNTPVEISNESVTDNDATEVFTATMKETDNNNALPVAPEIILGNNFSTTVHLTENIANDEDEYDDIHELDSEGVRRASKPMVYYTSDPDFWTKVTDGKDSNVIYFFQVKSSPRVETDRQRTIYPDGTILEELTETVYDGEGGAPKVTKSSKLIRPDDLKL